VFSLQVSRELFTLPGAEGGPYRRGRRGCAESAHQTAQGERVDGAPAEVRDVTLFVVVLIELTDDVYDRASTGQGPASEVESQGAAVP
jgi:hypothetical protein